MFPYISNFKNLWSLKEEDEFLSAAIIKKVKSELGSINNEGDELHEKYDESK